MTLGLPGRGRDGGRVYDGGREGSGGSPLASNVPTVPREDCEDDTSYRFDGIGGKKDCDWVAERPNKRCGKRASNEKKKTKFFCPSKCKTKCKNEPPSQTPSSTSEFICVDDLSYRFNGVGKKDCDWVSKSPSKRCERMDSNEMKKTKFFCPATCSSKCVMIGF